jgi:hypothetical protein
MEQACAGGLTKPGVVELLSKQQQQRISLLCACALCVKGSPAAWLFSGQSMRTSLLNSMRVALVARGHRGVASKRDLSLNSCSQQQECAAVTGLLLRA